MAKPFDISKFRKDITKSIQGLSIGFNDPTDWIGTGNYALNYLISGDFNKGIPLGKVTVSLRCAAHPLRPQRVQLLHGALRRLPCARRIVRPLLVARTRIPAGAAQVRHH